ncbi:ABC transporter ATP-binding protein [Nocardioides yefusunii]|uniref:ABC transporter ATP-binding protein n=1 Tax=Nocardioides yefusunii TaxID=2500546 RepID=A0ABW1QZA2_9ACTN|nr:ABC transporter ATP-binding protein [Nocardioides yefusunii]
MSTTPTTVGLEPAAPAVELDDVTVRLPRAGGDLQILHGVSFKVPAGSVVALAGESGSGKSTAALSLMRLLPWGARVGGRIMAGDRDVAAMGKEELRRFRASEARIILQDPWSSLHPMKSVGAQMVESARSADPSLSKEQARSLAVEMMAKVRIPDPESRLKAYPHEMSGGQLQRVLIAMALVAKPKLLLCDEPTTALDVSTQAQILDLLRELNREMGLTIVIATHDLDVIAGLADRLVVMYAGRVVEEGPTKQVMANPQHPYTWALLQTAPKHNTGQRMRTIEGRPPALDALPSGCSFAARCQFTTDECHGTRPELVLVDESAVHRTACLRVQAAAGGKHRAPVTTTPVETVSEEA